MPNSPSILARTRSVVVAFALLSPIATVSQPASAEAAQDTACRPERAELSAIPPRFEQAASIAADSFAALAARESAPGAAIAVNVAGTLAWSAAHGKADVVDGRPVCPDTRFRTGSVSKVLTALALLRLVDEGRVDLDADARDLVPAAAHHPEPVTLRLLAGHLGGIRHYRSADEYMNTRRYERVADALHVFVSDSLVAPPGVEYQYSSYGYNLLGAALAAAAGTEYAEATRRLVLDPLELTDVSPEASTPTEMLATAHSLRDGTLVPSPAFDPSDRVPSGGWVASAADLAAIGHALLDPAFLSDSSRALLLASQRTAAGKETGTSIGVRIGTDAAGRRILHHGGTSVGARAFLLVYPDHDVSVAVLMNGPAEYAEEAVARLAAPFLER